MYICMSLGNLRSTLSGSEALTLNPFKSVYFFHFPSLPRKEQQIDCGKYRVRSQFCRQQAQRVQRVGKIQECGYWFGKKSSLAIIVVNCSFGANPRVTIAASQ